MQGYKIISKTLSFSVKIFLKVNCIQIASTFNLDLIFKQKQSNIKSQQKYIPQYVSTTIYVKWLLWQQNLIYVYLIWSNVF